MISYYSTSVFQRQRVSANHSGRRSADDVRRQYPVRSQDSKPKTFEQPPTDQAHALVMMDAHLRSYLCGSPTDVEHDSNDELECSSLHNCC